MLKVLFMITYLFLLMLLTNTITYLFLLMLLTNTTNLPNKIYAWSLFYISSLIFVILYSKFLKRLHVTITGHPTIKEN